MYCHMSIHRPAPGARDALVDSMHRYGAALAGAPGLLGVHTLEDAGDGVLVGLALWESEQAFLASVHLARQAVAGDPFEEWEAEAVQGFRLAEV